MTTRPANDMQDLTPDDSVDRHASAEGDVEEEEESGESEVRCAARNENASC